MAGTGVLGLGLLIFGPAVPGGLLLAATAAGFVSSHIRWEPTLLTEDDQIGGAGPHQLLEDFTDKLERCENELKLQKRSAYRSSRQEREALQKGRREASAQLVSWLEMLSEDPADEVKDINRRRAEKLLDAFNEALGALRDRAKAKRKILQHLEHRLRRLRGLRKEMAGIIELSRLEGIAESDLGNRFQMFDGETQDFWRELERLSQDLDSLATLGAEALAHDMDTNDLDAVSDRINDYREDLRESQRLLDRMAGLT